MVEFLVILGNHLGKRKIWKSINSICNNPNRFQTEEEIYEECRRHLNQKFGKNGYAVNKIYFDDKDYLDYLEKMDEITTNKEEFDKVLDKIK